MLKNIFSEAIGGQDPLAPPLRTPLEWLDIIQGQSIRFWVILTRDQDQGH